MRVGDLVIVNDADRPCSKLVAEVIAVDGDYFSYIYLDRRVGSTRRSGRVDRATSVYDFGVYINESATLIELNWTQSNPSRATYLDGRRREWQPCGEWETQLRDDIPVSGFVKNHAVSTVLRESIDSFVVRFDFLELENYFLPLVNKIMSGELETLREIDFALDNAKRCSLQDVEKRNG